MELTELKKEYAIQNNRATACPFYVTVQELFPIGVIAVGYSVNCPHGDGITKYEHNCDNCDFCDECENDINEEPVHCSKDVQVGYIWNDIEFFLTIKAAEKFIKEDAHNHGKLRTYIKNFNRKNYEMINFFKEIGFKHE